MTSDQAPYAYAKAFTALFKEQDLPAALQNLNGFLIAFHKKDVEQFFLSPKIPDPLKEEVLKKNFSGNENVFLFLTYLLRKKMLPLISKIVTLLDNQLKKKESIITGKLVLASPLDPEERNKLLKILEKKYQKKVSLEESIDPKLLGGGMLLIENQLIDFSIKRKLSNLKESLLSKR